MATTTVRTIQVYRDVGAVASLGDEIFVVCLNNHDQIIQVYSAETLQLRRQIPVPGLGCVSWGLAACGRYKCLYVSDWAGNAIHRTELPGGFFMKWSVAPKPAGLTLNENHNLMVVSQGECKLQIFTTHGVLLQNMQLLNVGSDGVQNAIHQAIRHPAATSDGAGIVFTCFNEYGAELRSRRGSNVYTWPNTPQGESVRLPPLNRPAGITMDKSGNVLVADWYNNRMLVYGHVPEYLKHIFQFRDLLPVTVKGGLKGPCSLWYDQEAKRLCIGECEWSGHRVIVVDNLAGF